jgi:6-phosphogluconolactonase/glucosamine-6-phosphate isomerase/deaminase
LDKSSRSRAVSAGRARCLASVASVAAAAPAAAPFTVALSGGSLPKLLAAGLLNQKGIDYSNWHVFFADERVVSPSLRAIRGYGLIDCLCFQVPLDDSDS